MKNTKTKYHIITTNIHSKKDFLVCKVVSKGDAYNILKMLNSQSPEYLTYTIATL